MRHHGRLVVRPYLRGIHHNAVPDERQAEVLRGVLPPEPEHMRRIVDEHAALARRQLLELKPTGTLLGRVAYLRYPNSSSHNRPVRSSFGSAP